MQALRLLACLGSSECCLMPQVHFMWPMLVHDHARVFLYVGVHACRLCARVLCRLVHVCMFACGFANNNCQCTRAPLACVPTCFFYMRWSLASNCLPDSERVCVRLCSRAHCVHECRARVTLIVVCAYIDCARICMRAVRLCSVFVCTPCMGGCARG